MMILKQMILMVRMMRVWLGGVGCRNSCNRDGYGLLFSGGKDKEKTSESV
jgi:hypothetical protein